MRLAILGAGHVGLASAGCFAEAGNHVVCADTDAAKIAGLQAGRTPLYEPGLVELLSEQQQAGRLIFSAEPEAAVRGADVIAVAVGTPSLPNGEADVSYVMAAAKVAARGLTGPAVLMIKSTVPVGTNAEVSRLMHRLSRFPVHVASVPEFMSEGSALRDTRRPDRVVIGLDGMDDGDETVLETYRLLQDLHKPFGGSILCTDSKSAEMIKYASNAFLAAKISFVNEMAKLCELTGADISEVARGIGMDRRIGSAFLKAGIGYGGSCLPKDIRALLGAAEAAGDELPLLAAVEGINREQPLRLLGKLAGALGSLDGKTIAVWGLSYKPGTDDVREAPALGIIRALLRDGAAVRAYDPAAIPSMRRFFEDSGSSSITWCASADEAAKGSDAVCLLTEWEEFASFDLSSLVQLMRHPVLIDGRNVYDRKQAERAGLIYHSMGRPAAGIAESGGKL